MTKWVEVDGQLTGYQARVLLHSRPRDSDDNDCAESLFRAAKYRPGFPTKGFAGFDQARTWAGGFFHWYNFGPHSGIHTSVWLNATSVMIMRFWLPASGYLSAHELNPARWSGDTRNLTPITAVTVNPKRDFIIKMYFNRHAFQPLAAQHQ